jgi:predicted phage terminase large subunit-like protein
LGVVAVNPGAIGDKQTRAKFSQVRYEAGDVLLPANNDAHWLGGFIDQHLSFPNGSNDDEIDAESQAVYYFEAGEDPTEEYDRLLNAFGG